MSIRESHRSPRERWPLQFDLEGVPRDNQTRERLLADLRSENPEIYPMNIPQVKNSFATDDNSLVASLTPAQKEKLLKELLASNQGGQEFDLSKPPVAPYRYQEYPKALWTPDGKKQMVAHTREHEKQLVAAGHSATKPEPVELAAKDADSDSAQEAEGTDLVSDPELNVDIDRPRRRR